MALQDRPVVRRLVSFAKNSPWLMIAFGLHVILAAVLSIAYVRREQRKPVDVGTRIAVGTSRPPEAPLVLPEVTIERQAIPEALEAELVDLEDVATFIPTEELPAEIDWHEEVGTPTGTDEENSSTGGTSIGVGQGGWRGTGPSGILRGRPGAGNAGKPGRPTAATPIGTEKAVREGLCWLMRHQEEDGSWSAATLARHCSTKETCIPAGAELDTDFDAGMTALALLAFLGQGIGPATKTKLTDEAMGRPPRTAGEIVKKGIAWLLASQRPDGSFSGSVPFAFPENDTLSTMALCEASALSRGNTLVKRKAQAALDFLVAAQKRDAGGAPWGWGIGSQRDLDERLARGELAPEAHEEACRDVDLSITCWVVMALKSAQTCGFRVPDESLAGALAYARDATGKGALEGDANVFLDPADRFDYHAARKAALGMLIRAFAGGDIDDPFLAEAAREIAADPPCVTKDQLSVDFYYWYFATLALNQYDGPDSPRTDKGAYWKPWNEALVAALPPLQDRSRARDVCARGGWLQEARGNRRGRALYNTALNVLTLEVYYRFENVFGVARAR